MFGRAQLSRRSIWMTPRRRLERERGLLLAGFVLEPCPVLPSATARTHLPSSLGPGAQYRVWSGNKDLNFALFCCRKCPFSRLLQVSGIL